MLQRYDLQITATDDGAPPASAVGTYAVALLEPEPGANASGLAAEYDNNWGLSILDLLDDRSIDFALEAEPIGLEFAGGEEDSDFALLLLDGAADGWTGRSCAGGTAPSPTRWTRPMIRA